MRIGLDAELPPQLAAVQQRLQQLLDEAEHRFPVPLRITGWYDNTGRMCGSVHFKVAPARDYEGIQDCSEEVGRIEKTLTIEFGKTVGSPLKVDLPATLRGPHAVLDQEAQRQEVEANRRVRKDKHNG